MEEDKIDFQPNYLVHLTKLKLSELKSIWKTDFSFRKYVRNFWYHSQLGFIDSLVSILENSGAEIDADFSGCIPYLDGIVTFKVGKELSSIEGFVEGLSKIEKEYALFSSSENMLKKFIDNSEESEEYVDLFQKIAIKPPVRCIVYNDLKKAWSAFKKCKNSETEVKLYDLVIEQVVKMEQVFVSTALVSFEWIADDSHIIELLGEFVEAFDGTLYYDMMNKRFMEVSDIKLKNIDYGN